MPLAVSYSLKIGQIRHLNVLARPNAKRLVEIDPRQVYQRRFSD